MIQALQKIKRKQAHFDLVIDVGAGAGTWYQSAVALWPKSKYILMEPLEQRQAALWPFASPNVQIVQAAASFYNGSISFGVASNLDGSGIYDGGHSLTVDCRTIDSLIQQPTGSILLKFDIHGHEVAALAGVGGLFRSVDFVVMECYNFRISKDCLLFGEMCSHMQALGFRVFDIVDLMHRKDEVLWQMDLVFMRETRSEYLRNYL